MTPFQVVYGRTPPHLVSYLPGSSRVAAIDQALGERDRMLAHIRENLLQAKSRMKNAYNKAHREHSYAPCDYVWLHLHRYRQVSLTASKRHNLSPKYSGPFQIVECIGSIAYLLQLPADAHIHDVFHVSLLKPFKGDSPMLHTPLPPLRDGRILPTPAHVYRGHKVNDHWELLVHWAETDPVDASWQPLAEFQKLFPNFELENKLFLHEGSDVMDSIASRVTARHRT
ncbi:uncharacterized protein [Aristolochia californica]|uniref:uncharacterized protein n=1 Tax=Aristolochia californica TaxID=171875 RepID=UPI0035E14E86